MARVTVAESQKIARSTKGVRMFNFEMGGFYHILFLGEKVGDRQEPIMYMNPTHNIKKDGKGFEVRCANEKHNISNVVLRDANGELMRDPRTGKPLNDGTCPYCEVRKLYNKYAFAKRDQWIKENPTASKEEIKKYTKKLFEKATVSDVSQVRVMLVAVFELDQKGKPLTDADGNKIYTIQAMKFSEHRFTNKLLDQVEIKKMSLDDENDGGIAWHEYYFKFPKADNKMLSGKDMSITPVASPILASDPGLRAKLEAEIAELDLDALEEQLYVFKLKTLEEMERDVAPQRSRIIAAMSDEDIAEAMEELGEEELVDEDDINEIMGEEVGSASFKLEVTDEDIDNLM